MQEAELPVSSVAVHVTALVPGFKLLLSCGLQLTSGVGSRLSDTIILWYSTGLAVTTILGHVIVGASLSIIRYVKANFKCNYTDV